MTRFAESTSVPADRSRAEIERTLQRWGATGFMYGWQESSALVAFVVAGRQVRFILPLPDQDDPQFARTPAKRQVRSPEQRLAAWEQATRQRWRALALVIKAKLEAVETGIVTFEQEFLPHLVLPDGSTVHDWIAPQMEQVYEKGIMPRLLPQLTAGGAS